MAEDQFFKSIYGSVSGCSPEPNIVKEWKWFEVMQWASVTLSPADEKGAELDRFLHRVTLML